MGIQASATTSLRKGVGAIIEFSKVCLSFGLDSSARGMPAVVETSLSFPRRSIESTSSPPSMPTSLASLHTSARKYDKNALTAHS